MNSLAMCLQYIQRTMPVNAAYLELLGMKADAWLENITGFKIGKYLFITGGVFGDPLDYIHSEISSLNITVTANNYSYDCKLKWAFENGLNPKLDDMVLNPDQIEVWIEIEENYLKEIVERMESLKKQIPKLKTKHIALSIEGVATDIEVLITYKTEVASHAQILSIIDDYYKLVETKKYIPIHGYFVQSSDAKTVQLHINLGYAGYSFIKYFIKALDGLSYVESVSIR